MVQFIGPTRVASSLSLNDNKTTIDVLLLSNDNQLSQKVALKNASALTC